MTNQARGEEPNLAREVRASYEGDERIALYSQLGVDDGHEAVFYFDVLGFRHLASGTVGAVADTPNALVEILHRLAVIQQTTSWSHCYSRGDSICVMHLGLATRQGGSEPAPLHFSFCHSRPRDW
jgi:hypothetical protein